MRAKLFTFIFLVAAVLPFAASAQTAKTRANLYTEIDSTFVTGVQTTNAQLRLFLKNAVASAENGLTDGTGVTITGSYMDPAWIGSLSATKLTGTIPLARLSGITNTEIAAGAAIAISKISGLQAAIDGKANASHTHEIADTTGLQVALDAKAAKASNLSDLSDPAAAFGNIKQPATTSSTGVVELATDGESASGLAVQANDTRLSNARTPTAHTHVSTDISDSTAAGRTLLTAANAAAQKAALSLAKADVGLTNADDTSDATKNAAAVTLTNKIISGTANTLTNLPAPPIGFGADGGATVLGTSDPKPVKTVDYAGVILGWTLYTREVGSFTVGVEKSTNGGDSWTSIVASAPPSITTDNYATTGSIGTWTTSFAAGDLFRATITSTSGAATYYTLSLQTRRN
jgi:hypothetical protein